MTPQAASAPASAARFLVPTRWEVEVTCAAATALVLVLVPVALYALLRPRRAPAAADGLQLVDKCHEGAPSAYAVNLKLLAAKDLIAANLNGTSDPYALITCGQDKRFRYEDEDWDCVFGMQYPTDMGYLPERNDWRR